MSLLTAGREAAIVRVNRHQNRKNGKTAMTDRTERDCLSRVAGSWTILRELSSAGAGPRKRCDGMVLGGRLAVIGHVKR